MRSKLAKGNDGSWYGDDDHKYSDDDTNLDHLVTEEVGISRSLTKISIRKVGYVEFPCWKPNTRPISVGLLNIQLAVNRHNLSK